MEKKLENEMDSVIMLGFTGVRVPQDEGNHFGGPNSEDYSIWGSILGSPHFGKLPYTILTQILHDLSIL